jgi:hypothetical protein
MKEKKSTTKRLSEFAESYDTDIILISFMFVQLAVVVAIPIILNKIAWVFCAPLALMLVYVIARGIIDLIVSYRWYFGLDKDKSKQKLNQ